MNLRLGARPLVLASIGLVLVACLIAVFAQQQRRRRVSTGGTAATPRVVTNTTRTAITTVKAGGDFQRALNDARAGDMIVLEAGAEFVGSFTLPYKTGDAYITVRSSAVDEKLPPPNERITPAYAASMPKIVSPGQGLSALATEKRAHHFRFIGIEFKPQNADAMVYDLVRLGDGSSTQNSLDQVPHHLILDRCYIHGIAGAYLKRGVALNSAETQIINSYVSDCKAKGQDAQAVMGWNGPGPFRIINNYLEGSGENILFGGADATIPNLVPSDIEIRGNVLTKPLSWRGVWSVKNLFELKNARRVTVEGNLMEYAWRDGQDGTAVLFTVRNQDGTAPWSVVEDVQFVGNIVRHAGAGINILGRDNNHPSGQTKNIQIKNNLFEDINGAAWSGSGNFLVITEAANISVEHNTILQTGNITEAYGQPTTGFVFRNNIVAHNAYGFHGAGRAPGTDSLDAFFPKSIVVNNAIIGGDASQIKGRNMFPVSLKQLKFVDMEKGDYRLRPDSPLKKNASDNTDIGANMNALTVVDSFR